MKIAFVVGVEFPTPSKSFIVNQITGLLKRGHTVDIFADCPGSSTVTHGDVDAFQLRELTHYDVPCPGPYLWRLRSAIGLSVQYGLKNPLPLLGSLNMFQRGKHAASLRLIHQAIPALNKSDYDVVHCHFGYNGIKVLPLRELGLLQGKLVITFHGSDLTRYLQRYGQSYYTELFQKADLLLPISNHWKKKLIELNAPAEKIEVHRMGIDCQSFVFHPRQVAEQGVTRFISVSRLTEKKGLEYAIRAISLLSDLRPNLRFSIVGDGPLRAELQHLIKMLQLEDVVELMGWKSNNQVVELLQKSHVLLAPSVTSQDGDQEGIPVAIMEALAMGLPVVSTIHSGIPELIQDASSGYLVPERDVTSLAERIRYLASTTECWSSLGQAGRIFVEKNYEIEKLNDRLVHLYEQL